MKLQVEITLYISELLYDIRNRSYLAGRSQTESLPESVVSSMQADDTPESENQILRFIDSAVKTLKGLLGEYLDTSVMPADTELVLTLSVPGNFNEAAVSTLTGACHEYVVNTALAEWYAMTNPAAVQNCRNSAQENILNAKTALGMRKRPVRTSIP